MKAITVKQPWAWAIIHGGKDVENRSQQFAYRGPLAIHAAKVDDDGGWDRCSIHPANRENLPRGVVLGVVDLAGCHRSSDAGCRHCASPWGNPGLDVTHLVLARPRPLPTFVAARGMLGIWTLPDDVAAAVREQVPS